MRYLIITCNSLASMCTHTCIALYTNMMAQGPFVHLSSIIAHQMSKLITTVNQLYAVSSINFMAHGACVVLMHDAHG